VERRKMRARGVEVAGQGPFIEGEGVGCLLFDWLGWVAAHLIVGVVERQVLQEKKVRREGWPKLSCQSQWSAPILPRTSEQCVRDFHVHVHRLWHGVVEDVNGKL
jgi:hypothetical protein